MANAEPMSMSSTFMDYPEHERTYRTFTAAAKWGTVAVAVLVILMATFLI